MEEVEVENKDEQLTNKTNELETCKRELEKSNNQFTSEFQKNIYFFGCFTHTILPLLFCGFYRKKYLFFIICLRQNCSQRNTLGSRNLLIYLIHLL